MRESFHKLPKQYESAFARLQAASTTFHKELALAFEPLFNQKLREMPHDDLESKRRVCTWANEQLRMLGLTIRCPTTQRPAILVAIGSGESENAGRFRLETRDPDGRVARTVSSADVPELNLMEQPVREESFARSYRPRSKPEPRR